MIGRFSDERGMITKTVLLILIVFALLGVTIIDGSSILFGKWQLSDIADSAAIDAAVSYANGHDEKKALESAQLVLNDRDPDAKITGLEVDPRTDQITLTIEKTASTLIIGNIGALKGLAHLEETSTATPPMG